MRDSRLIKLILFAMLGMISIGFAGTSTAGANEVGETATGCEGHSDSVARLYRAAFLRPAEQAGFDYWMVTYTSGTMSLTQIAEYFSGSPELVALYGNLTDAEYVERLYLNVLDRAPDAQGLQYWLGEMASGMDRGTLLLRFTESPEFAVFTGTAPPTDGYYGNGLSGMWECGVDQTSLGEVSTAFANAMSEQNSTKVAMLSAGRVSIIDADLPAFNPNDIFAVHGHPPDPQVPWCQLIGDVTHECFFTVVDDADFSWTLQMFVTPEGYDPGGSPGTGRWIVTSYEVREEYA